jgi:putative RecB family exonuclease
MLLTGVKMLEVACKNWMDDFAVESVAETFSVSVPGLSKPLIGEFDCVVTDGRDRCIVDWKTASTKWPLDKADKDLQATAFCYAFREKYGEKPLFRFDVYTKAKSPSVNNHYTLRTDNELERFVSLANQIEKSVASGNFYPNESGFGCGECPYRDRCKKWR